MKQSIKDDKQLLLTVQGNPGTGKSLVLRSVCDYLERKSVKYQVVASTGIVAANCQGQTIASFFSLPFKAYNLERLLHSPVSKQLKERVAGLRFLLIDEILCVDAVTFNFINQRLQILLGNDKLFGGLSVFACGDAWQFHSLGISLIDNPTDPFSSEGCRIFKSFDQFRLKDNIRQQDDLEFQTIIEEIRLKKLTLESYNILATRHISNLSTEEIEKFAQHSVHIFPLRKQAAEFNLKQLEAQPEPIIRIPVSQRPKSPMLVEEPLYIAKNCRVRLTANLLVKHNLVSGSIGTVVDVLYKANHTPNIDFPICIFCRFDNYTGDVVEEQSVPIFPISESVYVEYANRRVSVRRFPLQNCSGLTCHLSQGSTLDLATIFLSEEEHFLPYSLVAITRVRSLKHLMFIGPISYDRFTNQSFYRGFKEFQSKLKALEEEFDDLGDKMIQETDLSLVENVV